MRKPPTQAHAGGRKTCVYMRQDPAVIHDGILVNALNAAP